MIVFINENSVFLVSGANTKQVQKIDFEGVTNLIEAKQTQWVMLGSLTYTVDRPGVQFYKNKLFVIGISNSVYSDSVQSFDLSTNTTKISGV